jgi:hypothetical protein
MHAGRRGGLAITAPCHVSSRQEALPYPSAYCLRSWTRRMHSGQAAESVGSAARPQKTCQVTADDRLHHELPVRELSQVRHLTQASQHLPASSIPPLA